MENWKSGKDHSVPGKITVRDSCFQSEKGRHMLHSWTCEALFCHLGWRELLWGFREGELQEMRNSWARSFLLMPGTCSQHGKPHTSFSKGETDRTIHGTQPCNFQRWIATFPWPWGQAPGLDSVPRPAQSQPGRVLPVMCDLTENGTLFWWITVICVDWATPLSKTAKGLTVFRISRLQLLSSAIDCQEIPLIASRIHFCHSGCCESLGWGCCLQSFGGIICFKAGFPLVPSQSFQLKCFSDLFWWGFLTLVVLFVWFVLRGSALCACELISLEIG